MTETSAKKDVQKLQRTIVDALLLTEYKSLNIKTIIELMISNKFTTKKRLEVLNNIVTTINKPPYSLIDKIEWLSDSENNLLGVAISCSKLDTYDITMTNCDCKTFKNSHVSDKIILAGEIMNINTIKTKSGKNPGQEMSFVSIEDQTGYLDSVIFFPEAWTKYKTHIFNGNILIFIGNKAKTKDGFIVEKCFIPRT